MTRGLWQFGAQLFQHKSLLLPFQELLQTCYLLWLFGNFLSPGAVKSDAGSALPSLLLQSPVCKPKESPLLQACAGSSCVGMNSITSPWGTQGLFSKCLCAAVGGGCAVSVGSWCL